MREARVPIDRVLEGGSPTIFPHCRNRRSMYSPPPPRETFRQLARVELSASSGSSEARLLIRIRISIPIYPRHRPVWTYTLYCTQSGAPSRVISHRSPTKSHPHAHPHALLCSGCHSRSRSGLSGHDELGRSRGLPLPLPCPTQNPAHPCQLHYPSKNRNFSQFFSWVAVFFFQ